MSWRIDRDVKLEPTRVNPLILYHGTSSKHLASIKRHGLVPAGRAGIGATGSRNWKLSGGSREDMIGLVGLTDKTRSAAFYASLVAPPVGRSRSRPVIIVVDKRKIQSKLLVRRRGSSVGGGREWDYPKIVPKSAIIGYWVYAKARSGRRRWVFKRRYR